MACSLKASSPIKLLDFILISLVSLTFPEIIRGVLF